MKDEKVNPLDSPTVSLARCRRYHLQSMRTAMRQLLEPFGGIEALVRPGQRVLLKPNLLAAAAPAEAVTTHPLVIKVLAELVLETGGTVFIGDSPGSDQQEEAHRISGMQRVMEETGAKMLLFKEIKAVKASGFNDRVINLAAELDQVDLVINAAKLKTHALTVDEQVPFLIDTDIDSKEFRKNWGRLIQKVYSRDPLVCPKCNGKMKVIARFKVILGFAMPKKEPFRLPLCLTCLLLSVKPPNDP